MKTDTNIIRLPNIIVWVYFSVIAIVLSIVAICDDVTGDEGDSISHFMFSKYSWENPHYFIDLWAKPLFTLLSSPFSQLGFVGIRCFNLLMALGTAYVIWQIAKKLEKPLSSFTILILFSIAFYTLKIFSGYTEFLYAFLLSLSILLCLNHKYLIAAIIVSFFPFCRSEGIIAIGMFAIYLIWDGNWKYLPVLVFGHIVYEFVGITFFEQDFGWTWNKIPYLDASSGYGNGRWFDMAEEFVYRSGIPILILSILGIIYKAVETVPNLLSLNDRAKVDIILIYGNAVAFFVAHSIFWTFGLFNSFGLGRVFIAIMPLVAIISLDGFNLLRGNLIPTNVQKIIALTVIASIIFTAFDKNKVGFRFVRGINKIPQNELVKNQIQPYLETNFSDNKIFYNIAYLAIVREENYYGQGTESTWFRKPDLEAMDKGSIFVWDSKFAQGDAKISKDALIEDPRFLLHQCFTSDSWNGYYTYCVFERIN